jgi:hypothetical protein
MILMMIHLFIYLHAELSLWGGGNYTAITNTEQLQQQKQHKDITNKKYQKGQISYLNLNLSF